MPMVQNLVNEKWNRRLLARAIADEPHRQRLISGLTTFVEENKFGGVCVDFEEPPRCIAGKPADVHAGVARSFCAEGSAGRAGGAF